jgi:hypothetical protein
MSGVELGWIAIQGANVTMNRIDATVNAFGNRSTVRLARSS